MEKEINMGIELNLENVYNSVEEICERIISTGDPKVILKERIFIQKSTVSMETLQTMHYRIKKIIKKYSNTLIKILDQNFNIDEFASRYYQLVNIPNFWLKDLQLTI